MIHAATFLLSLAGFALLLLAMARHQQDWLCRKLPASRSRGLRLSGFLMLALAFVIAAYWLRSQSRRPVVGQPARGNV